MRDGPYGALFRTLLCLYMLACAGLVHGADEGAPDNRPVEALGDRRLQIKTPAGVGGLALYASRELGDGTNETDIERAVLVFHGRLRNADVYWRSAQRGLH